MTYLALNFTAEEQMLIDDAWRDGILDWNSKSLLAVRRKIRDHHRGIQADRCCYCRKNFVQDHPLSVDIEHILPKSKYRKLAIEKINLSVACKRCNMTIKSDRQDFICGSLDFLSAEDLADSTRYEVIHPNIDVYLEHIRPVTAEAEGLTLRRYVVAKNSSKGEATVKFFLLRELEEDTLDEIQGLEGESGHERAHQIRRLLGL